MILLWTRRGFHLEVILDQVRLKVVTPPDLIQKEILETITEFLRKPSKDRPCRQYLLFVIFAIFLTIFQIRNLVPQLCPASCCTSSILRSQLHRVS